MTLKVWVFFSPTADTFLNRTVFETFNLNANSNVPSSEFLFSKQHYFLLYKSSFYHWFHRSWSLSFDDFCLHSTYMLHALQNSLFCCHAEHQGITSRSLYQSIFAGLRDVCVAHVFISTTRKLEVRLSVLQKGSYWWRLDNWSICGKVCGKGSGWMLIVADQKAYWGSE